MKIFLNAKGWQLFLIMTGSMFAGPYITSAFPDSNLGITLTSLIFMSLYVGWLWAIATKANQKLDPPLRRSTKWLGIGLIYAIAYLAIALMLFPSTTNSGPGLPGFIIPMHLLAMSAVFYALVFAAKRIVTLEKNQEVTFFEYSGPFFLLWFFPIGVWFIQPRVNKMLGNSDA